MHIFQLTTFSLLVGISASLEPEAILYEGTVSKGFHAKGDTNTDKLENKDEQQNGLKYTDNPDLWADIHSIQQNFGFTSLKLCVTGVFLLYRSTNFEASDASEVRLVYGIKKCLPVDDVGSIQMAASLQNVYAPLLTVFKDTHLKGGGFPLARSVGDFQSFFENSVESLIINGPSPWTIVSTTSKSYCLQPTFDNNTISFPICILTTMNDTVIRRDTQWRSIQSECKGKDTLVEVKSCLNLSEDKPTVEKEKPEEDKESTTPKPPIDEYVPLAPAITECNKNEDFLTLLDLRLNNDFSSSFQFRFPKDKGNAWRTDIIDTVFEIITHVCPVVDENVLGMFNEMFVYMIEKHVWSKGAGWPKNHTDDPEIVRIASELEQCLESSEQNDNILHIMDSVGVAMNYIESSQNSTNVVMLEFQRNYTLDFMMEMVWLAANQITSICHISSDGETNFWVDFYPIFKQMYLTPMVKFWGSPGEVEKLYPYIFGGMQLHLEYEGMALCASYYTGMSHLDIYTRPSELTVK